MKSISKEDVSSRSTVRLKTLVLVLSLLLILSLSLIILLSFFLFSPNIFSTTPQNQNNNELQQISDEGHLSSFRSREFKCKGKCFIEKTSKSTRRAIAGSSLKFGMSYLVAASSLLFATNLARKHFKEECRRLLIESKEIDLEDETPVKWDDVGEIDLEDESPVVWDDDEDFMLDDDDEIEEEPPMFYHIKTLAEVCEETGDKRAYFHCETKCDPNPDVVVDIETDYELVGECTTCKCVGQLAVDCEGLDKTECRLKARIAFTEDDGKEWCERMVHVPDLQGKEHLFQLCVKPNPLDHRNKNPRCRRVQ